MSRTNNLPSRCNILRQWALMLCGLCLVLGLVPSSLQGPDDSSAFPDTGGWLSPSAPLLVFPAFWLERPQPVRVAAPLPLACQIVHPPIF